MILWPAIMWPAIHAHRDFTVAIHSRMRGMRLRATDGPFVPGDVSPVTGTTLALTMAMARRVAFCADLDGEDVAILRERSQKPRRPAALCG